MKGELSLNCQHIALEKRKEENTMSTQLFINKESVKYLMLNTGKYLLGSHLVSVQLQTPTIEGLNRKEKAQSGKLATKENHAENLENLREKALLEFVVTIIAPVTYTSHKHELLAEQNQTAQEMSDVFKAHANLESIELERDTFLGETIDASALHGIIKNYVKLGKNQKISQKWRKNKGAYQIAKNGEFVPYAAQEKPIESPKQKESENIAPNLAEIAAQVMNMQAPMTQIEARKAAQAAKKAAKQAKQDAAKAAIKA